MGIKAMKNEKEFLELIEFYKRIDKDWLDEVAQEHEHEFEEDWAEAIMTDITGFGVRGSCTLCKAVKLPVSEKEYLLDIRERHKLECSICAYRVITGSLCYYGVNKKTYNAIIEARTIENLEIAVHAREKHMEDIYTKFKNNEIQRKGSIT